MITYDAIRKVMMDERNSTKLTELPENFFAEVMAYLESKAKLRQNKEDAWEFESAKRLVQDILEIREKKVVNLALYHVRSGISPGKLTNEEKELFDSVVESAKTFQKRMKETLSGRREKLVLIAMLDDVPEFMGTDMKSHGPFKKGDMVTLPEETAEFLISKGLGQRVSGEEPGRAGENREEDEAEKREQEPEDAGKQGPVDEQEPGDENQTRAKEHDEASSASEGIPPAGSNPDERSL